MFPRFFRPLPSRTLVGEGRGEGVRKQANCSRHRLATFPSANALQGVRSAKRECSADINAAALCWRLTSESRILQTTPQISLPCEAGEGREGAPLVRFSWRDLEGSTCEFSSYRQ